MAIKKKTILFIVDPQIDFCADHTHPVSALLPEIQFDIPDGKGGVWRPKMGALYVGGAMDDTKVLANHITGNLGEYDDIYVTQDSHQAVHIAHPLFWRGKDGKQPPPFTLITVKDLKDGTWAPAIPSLTKKAFAYVESLEKNGRYVLCIWPPHCRVGSLGCAFMPEIDDALNQWETTQFGRINIVPKGNNPFTEHYSGVQADVTDPADPTTKLNVDVIRALDDDSVGCVRFAGQALSHCVANTMRDIITNFGSGAASKVELIRNATSNVYGFQQMGDDFLNWFSGQGGKCITV